MSQYLLIAILSTIAMILAGGSVMIAPNPLNLIGFALFTIATTLNWVQFSKRKQMER